MEEAFIKILEWAYRCPWWGWLLIVVALANLYIFLNPGCCGPGPVTDMAPVYR